LQIQLSGDLLRIWALQMRRSRENLSPFISLILSFLGVLEINLIISDTSQNGVNILAFQLWFISVLYSIFTFFFLIDRLIYCNILFVVL
jgi:hypothetical protein